MYHSISLWPKHASNLKRKAARDENYVWKIIREIADASKSKHIINHKLHLRFDITFFQAIPALIEHIENGDTALLSFMDHTPGQGQYRDIEAIKKSMKASNPERSEAEIDKRLTKRMQVERISSEDLAGISRVAKDMGIPVASHDDDSYEKVDFVKNDLYASISEFPVELKIARYAKKSGMKTLGGAVNVMLGKSHSGNLSAADGILDGSIDMLCSDYYPPSMLQAAFKLHKQYDLPLWDTVKLITAIPADAVGIGNETGSIAEGKRADLIIVDAAGSFPNIVAVITNGKASMVLDYE
jgi:alpha-D-ribose 1-methylphosphonate 5-triphosphate diphosphatase